MGDKPSKTLVPVDRLTRISKDMLENLRNHKESEDKDRAIVLLFDENGNGGIGISGYDQDTDAMVDLYLHLKALCRANGQDLHLVIAGETPPGERA